MATYATLTVPVQDIIGADFNASRASVWIEPNVPFVLADSIRVGGRREQVVNGVATFANLVTTDTADNPASFGYRVTITAPPKGAAARKDIVNLTTADFPFTATAVLTDISEAWDNIVLPVEWRSAFRDEMEALEAATAAHRTAVENVVITDLGTTDGQTKTLIETDGTLTKIALSAAYVGVESDPLQPLDLWEGFDAAGGGTSWAATTYAGFLAGVQTALSVAGVTETDRGLCSNGSDRIYSYRAGTGPLKVLIVSGLHGDEILSCFLGLRWFQTFATSLHPVMVALRGRLTVEWVACANPDGYNTAKENANGVNLNRNFDFYESTSVAPNKGAAPFSEVESQIVKAIVDEGNLCVIDLHGRGPVTDNAVGFAPASSWTLSDQALVRGALATWGENYSDVWGSTPDELLLPYEPTLNNWASWYGRWDGTRRGNAAILLEIATDQLGSTSTAMSADASRALCGLMTTYLGMWIQRGLAEPVAYPVMTRATGPKLADGSAHTLGGNRLGSSTWAPMHWGAISPTSGGTAGDVIKVVAPYPCAIKVTVEGYGVYSGTAGGTAFRGTVGISFDDDTGPHVSTQRTFSVESTDANRRVGFQSAYRFEDALPDGETIHEVRVWFQRNAGGTMDVTILQAFVELVPLYDTYPHPTANQAP